MLHVIEAFTERMPRISKEKARANEFRFRAAELLNEPDWLDEGVRRWLEKELTRRTGDIYTENEHAALARIVAAGTLFDNWDGYTVPELLAAACRYKADGDYEDERILDELLARRDVQLRLGDMGHLIGFCRNVAGLPLSRFEPQIAKYGDFA